jgi:hypothetical protein
MNPKLDPGEQGQMESKMKSMSMTTKQAIEICRPFIGAPQMHAMICGLRGEERQHFADKFAEMAARIDTMPKTYEQDGAGDDAVAVLHYFAGGQADWWITEKDIRTPAEPGQYQAFGLADLFQDGGELGYISIVELLNNGAELDLHFTPKTLGELKLRAAHQNA